MAVKEQIPPYQLSILACVAAVLIGGTFWWLGAKKPDRWVATMAHNNHAGYGGGRLDCYACHRAEGSQVGFKTQLNCVYSVCHGELAPTMSPEAAVAEFRLSKGEFGSKISDEDANYYLGLHASVRTQACTDCHKEHQKYEVVYPPGFPKRDAKAVAWVSLLEERGAR